MDYEGFDSEYGRVLAAAGTLDAASLAVEVARLRALAEAVHPPADQEAAQRLMLSLDNALSTEQPALSEPLSAALRVHRQARTAQGTPDERIAHLRAAIAELTEIADSTTPPEPQDNAQPTEPPDTSQPSRRDNPQPTEGREGGRLDEAGRILELGDSLSVLVESLRLTVDDNR